MNSALAHRGPDADKVKIVNQGIGFGHRRLSIIDLDTRAEQPMVSNNGKTIIVFNGEIFNFQDLKKELEEYTFKTQSDTEVLLAGYELKGIKWLMSRINGMFAVAIYDTEEDKLILIRDRFGIKPLYYYQDETALIFSSEIKGILHSGLVEAKFNTNAIDDYLAFRQVREPYSFFKNIRCVRSATYLTFEKGSLKNEQYYWELPKLNFSQKYDELAILAETRSQVETAIKRWQIADVKVGSYLSGGVDSSLTSAILSQDASNHLHTYTIGFKEEKFNEFHYAQIVADCYQTMHHAFLLTQTDYFSEWNRLIGFKDAPLAVPNEIPLAIMSTRLSEDISVVISGEGADELFGGYGKIFRSSFDFRNHEIWKENTFYDYFTSLYEYVPRGIRDSFLSNKVNYREEFDKKIETDFSNYQDEENIFRFFHSFHIKGLLNRVDMTTMQASVEARPPFMDHELISFVYSEVPYDLKLKWNNKAAQKEAQSLFASEYSETLDTPKYILKKIAEEYLPKDVIYRKKMGFPVPLTNWFPEVSEKASKLLLHTEWLRKNKVSELCNRIKSTPSDRSGQILWMFLNIELFRQQYFEKTWKW